MRNVRLRGQAWVVFEEISSATAALSNMQGFNFFGKEMVGPDVWQPTFLNSFQVVQFSSTADVN